MRIRTWVSPLALGGLLLTVGCGGEEALKRVETEVGDLKLEVFKLRTQMEEANQRAEHEREASLAGRNQDRRFQADLQESLRQLQDTTRILNNRLGDTPAAPRKPVKGAAAPAEAPAAQSDDDKAFNAAMLDYNRGNYALAAESLAFYIKGHAQGSRVPDALFCMGLSYNNLKDFDKARVAFEQIVKEFPNSSQFLPAKLKRAQCLKWLGLKPAAIQAFKEIKSGFPGTSESRTAQQDLEDLGV